MQVDNKKIMNVQEKQNEVNLQLLQNLVHLHNQVKHFLVSIMKGEDIDSLRKRVLERHWYLGSVSRN